ncbi:MULTISPECIES: phosphoenolpyruvate synthase [unclassified Sulfurimonas]|uniref:phosphoenolpyruvate synthase n=1 Tax=unclassified Sulfurimonas TaxID=2623549 RepID=UPI0008C3FE5B|nr:MULTISPECIES: phosphoenolpyruvate synthase [unclassified Sulfurimonas]MBS4068826.1 phosphoenolpyruvate synthase [Sulfurimonas sp.]MDD3854466.1 phosphoenolpyruvate synthase [Sulfurimonas sp.]OHE04646.1 MAG: phosphoenolpyruvate synthase [Sulfurimonas sp. RIFOXYB12_FULL_35_9]
MQYIRFFNELNIKDVPIVGGKNASLGEMYQNLTPKGVNIPNGFATTSDAYWLLLEENAIKDKISAILNDLDIADTKNLQERGLKVRNLILNSHLPKALAEELLEAYKILSNEYGSQNIDVAVRSSATAEDLPDASFAGQQETFLNVGSEEELLECVLKCFASLFTDRAISYRTSRSFSHFKVALSVGVQKMVRSDISSSGIMFTIDTESGSENLILINSIWGLGENVVSGRVNADEFFIFKPTLKNGINTILKRSLGSKKEKMLYSEDTRTLNVVTTKEEQESFSINDDEVIELAKQALLIEEHYKRPMDIEWAKDGNDSKLYIVQARPETVMSKQNRSMTSQKYSLNAKGAKILISGRAIGEKIGTGKVTVINDTTEFARFNDGDILVADTTNPDWEPVMKKASAVITNRGSRTCHAAIVAREIGVPAVVGCTNATKVLKDSQIVTVSCAEGDEGHVYEGKLKYDIKTIDMSKLQPTKTKLFVNVGNPAEAFNFAKMPNDGVGLARMEFIMNNSINAHPMALVDMHKGKSVKDEDKIRSFMTPCSDAKEFFLQKISEGVGMIAAAFYPKPVIIRTSDFKSNEYRGMTGGLIYEAEEENPMIGFRGASRYYDDSYREAFMWECEALKRVRDDMGLSNIKIMIPFVRTPEEGKKVIDIMNEQGLIQGKNSLEIYAMCEIPANVILADKFLEVFDGYSIGSNDLTQLTLGVDRESAKIAHIFDERNEAVKRMLKMAIEACKKRDKYIGICGQAPSDYPEITEFLVQEGIDSISLNPDSLFKMRQVVSDLEERLSL